MIKIRIIQKQPKKIASVPTRRDASASHPRANFRVGSSPRRSSIDARQPTRQPHTMTLTNSFIAELVRDANRLDHLDDYQKRRMLERAVTTIRDMRETIGIPSGPGRDSLVDLHTVALSVERGWRSDEEVRNALLQAAGMIRDLHIVLDSKTEISLVKPAG